MAASNLVNQALLSIRGLSCRLSGRWVLRDISFDVAPGETIVLLGRSGCGKTTLLKCINRLVEAEGGEIRFQGRNTREWDPIQLRRRMGYVIQDAGLFPHWTIAANVGLLLRLNGWEPAAESARVRELLEMVGLDPAEFGPRYPGQLSGGQKQRVGIARALAADPPLLLLDEPFAALDPITRLDQQKQFLALRSAVANAAVFVTHDVREALLLATRIILLKDGAIDTTAGPGEFLSARTPEAKAFLAGLEEQWRRQDESAPRI